MSDAGRPATSTQEELLSARFRLALAHSGVVVFEHDLELRYTFIYPTQFYETSEVLGRTDAELFEGPYARRLMDLKREVIRSGTQATEEVHVVREGTRHDFVLTIDLLRDAHGNLCGLTGASTNITATKRVQSELARALDFRDQMIGILGHDLRNPMNAIRSSTQLLLAREEREETRRALLRIDRSSRRMTEMISTLLDFADTRFNAELKMNAATIDLADVVRSVADEVLAANPGRKIRLDAEREAIGFWDSDRLAQVVSNLLDNALKHGASDGEVWATVRLDEPETVVLRVSNAGAPIPAEAIGDLFKPFRAGRAARAASERSVDSSAQRGLGLGLYIVDQIVRAHAGTIDVQSSPESGTVFTVRLPQRGAPTRH